MKSTIIFILLILMISPAMADAPEFFTSTSKNNTDETPHDTNYFYSTGLLVPEHLKNTQYAVSSDKKHIISSELPSSWDWRDHNGVTPVKDQKNCGSCYAFASIGMIESYIKIDSGKTYDLSEEQAKNCMWESTGCLGGTIQWTINPFTANGIITEADSPYNPTNGLCQDIEPTLRLTEWNLLSTEKALDRATLKKYILNDGPVSTSLIVDNWNKTYNGSYVLSPDKEGKAHGVVLVGWNDSTSDKNVSGHWIFKNSWGTSWGDNGYGKIEYGSANIGTHVSVIGGYEKYDPDVYTLNYDEAGWNFAFGAVGFDTIRGMAIYNVSSSDEIEGIEFWTTGATSNIDIYLYDGWEGKKVPGKIHYLGNLTNELYSIKGLSYAEPGYHSIKINEEITSSTGKIIVVADITNTDCVYFDDKVAPIAVDHKGPSEREKTFVSIGDIDNKWYGWWYDAGALKLMTGTTEYADVALRLRVHGTSPVQCESILIETEGYVRTAKIGGKVNFTVNCIDEYGMPVPHNGIAWYNSNNTVGTMTESTFKGLSSGITTIYAEGPCKNTESNEITITVYKSSKDYLTEEEFQIRMAEIQAQLDNADTQHTDELQELMDILNTSQGDKTIYRMPSDAVSLDTFNKMMNDLQKQIDDMMNKNNSLFKAIINIIIDLLI